MEQDQGRDDREPRPRAQWTLHPLLREVVLREQPMQRASDPLVVVQHGPAPRPDQPGDYRDLDHRSSSDAFAVSHHEVMVAVDTLHFASLYWQDDPRLRQAISPSSL